ncbi:hypothetical protein [Comamonas thiooxydans]|uniref:hypothetical protein n=1 Tax=Comamonas thiooxydans TaxID=363952 RepID=UPI003D08528F
MSKDPKIILMRTDAEGLANFNDEALVVLDLTRTEIEAGNISSALERLCCTSRKADEITPAPDAAMPWHPRAPCSGARVA